MALLERPDIKPADLALYVQETRTNCYKILDNLVSAGLAERFDKDKKLHYRAMNPARLMELARAERNKREAAEQQLELHAQQLITTYIKTYEQPGISYFQGEAQIGKIFEEIAAAQQEVVFVHTRAGDDYYGFKNMHNLRMLAVNNEVPRRALTPDTDIATADYETFDPTVYLKRTWLRQSDYAAPVEWGAFDDKLYIIAYGQEALGVIVQSQTIATAFKQLFELMESGQRTQPWYHTLPRHAKTPGGVEPKL